MRTVPIKDTHTDMDSLHADIAFQHKCYQFFGTLRELSSKPYIKDVVEFGVFQGGSTSVFLSSPIRSLRSYDLDIGVCDEALFRKCNTKGIKWTLETRNSIEDGQVEPCDMLLLDTMHTFDHVWAELNTHGDAVNHYIVVHDTLYPPKHKNPLALVGDAVHDYARENGWEVIRKNKVGSGHMVIRRC